MAKTKSTKLTPRVEHRFYVINQSLAAIEGLGKKVFHDCPGDDEEMQALGRAIEALALRAGIAADKLRLDLGVGPADIVGWEIVDDPREQKAEAAHE